MRLELCAIAVVLAAPVAHAADEPLYVHASPGVAMHAGPSLASKVTGSAPNRAEVRLLESAPEVVEIDEETGRWVRVEYQGKTGWVFDRYLSFERPLAADEARRRLLEQPVACAKARLKLREGGGGTGAPEAGPLAGQVRNVRWWGEEPFFGAYELWEPPDAGAPRQTELMMCELAYNESFFRFDSREVDLRRRALPPFAVLGLEGGCPASADGCTALHRASAAGKDSEVAALLAKGALISARSRWGWTALHYAAWSGQTRVVDRLLVRGARADEKGTDGCAPLHLAAAACRPEVAARLLREKPDPDDPDRSGRTALHWAAEKGCAPVVKALLDARAQPDLPDAAGRTPLAWAAQRGQLEVARLLLARGADPNHRDKDDATPLHDAGAGCQQEMASLLLKSRADPSVRDRYGLAPAGRASFFGCPDAVRPVRPNSGEAPAPDSP